MGGRVAVVALDDVGLARLKRVLPLGRPSAVGGDLDVGARRDFALGRWRDNPTRVARDLAVLGGHVSVFAL